MSPQAPTNSPTGSFRAYLQGVGSSSMAQGLQIVLFPWLLVGVLGETPERVGLGQMALMLPQLLFVLWGGVLSDNRHPGRHLLRLYLLYNLPCLMLLAALVTGHLTYGLMLVFGFVFGTITAFVQPARESLLSRVVDTQLQQAVARASFVQFTAQSIGIVLAGYLEQVSLPLLLLVQLLLLSVSGWFLHRSLGTLSEAKCRHSGSTWQEMKSGLQLVRQDPRLLQLMMIVAATGFLGFGMYLVAMPLLTREVYHQGAAFFAWIQFSFMFGVILSNLVIIRLVGRFAKPGRILLVSLMVRGFFLVVISLHPPQWLLFLTIVLWGGASGLAMMLGRSMTHEESPQAYRARVVSVYQLALFGSAPIGAWLSGQAIAAFGVLPAIGVLGLLTVVAAIVAMLFSDLWKQQGPKRTSLSSVSE
ncbi:MFS transporter [Porticoccus litoralis]|uniref:MFS transporter n=1 Tax=Porticoccus litoralis TaxID=434086 RepID=A0AAW8B016_9GAMM|nr:MFS transporter [Porticoccus litoralis]MDP1519764.1 MFS transporter [Porticoccus litoralis]